LPHLPLEKQHQFILNQSYQVLKPSGQLLLSVWNLWQRRFWLHHLKQLPQKIKLKSLKSLCVPYKISDGRQVIKTASRYHYAFLPYQLKRFIKKAGFKIKKQQLKGKNFIFLAEKPKEA
jgi:SAM-dependent methyltransferase